MEYSSLKKYAFVKCSGDFSEIIIVDVASERVVHWNDDMVKNAYGNPYVAPDGKYVMITQYDRVCMKERNGHTIKVDLDLRWLNTEKVAKN